MGLWDYLSDWSEKYLPTWIDQGFTDVFRAKSIYPETKEELPKGFPYYKLGKIKLKDISDFYEEMNGALDTALDRINRRPGLNPNIIINRNAIAKNLKESYRHIQAAKSYYDNGNHLLAAAEVRELKQVLIAATNLERDSPMNINYLPDRIINSQIITLSKVLEQWLF